MILVCDVLNDGVTGSEAEYILPTLGVVDELREWKGEQGATVCMVAETCGCESDTTILEANISLCPSDVQTGRLRVLLFQNHFTRSP